MTIVRAQRIIQPKNGMGRDVKINTFYFDTGGSGAEPAADPTVGQLQTISDAIGELFNDATVLPAIRTWLGEQTMAPQRALHKFYNMSTPSPRPPLATLVEENPTPAITADALPSEVAMCVSFRTLPVAGISAARTRGRVYLGPLNIFAADNDEATGEAKPLLEFREACIQSFVRFQDTLGPAITWVTYSPTTDQGATAADASWPVRYVWVDNAFDTQRRRGLRADSRVFADVPLGV